MLRVAAPVVLRLLTLIQRYFWLWFEDYKKAYLHWQRSAPDPATPSPSLALSYSRAKETFFTHARPYELNLTEKTVQDLVTPTRPHDGPRQHPHPDAFAAVKYEIDGYLHEALRRCVVCPLSASVDPITDVSRFTANFSGNAGRNRGIFAMLLGTLVLACGCLPIVFSVLSARADAALPHVPHLSRWARLVCIPVLWLGFFALLAGLQGVCVLIFLFGDVRQLHAYELTKPRISSPLNLRPDAVRLGMRRGVSVSAGLEEGTLGRGRERSASLIYGKGGEIGMDMDMDMDDDGHSIMLKLNLGALEGTASESGISLDKIPRGTPAPLHASPNPNASANPNGHPHARISVDITQRPREGSVEITLAQTVEEDVYGIGAAPMSDTTIAVARTSYAAAPTTTAAAAAAARSATYACKPAADARADADAAAYRFDFDALPLPAGMTLPPWPQTLRAPPIAARRVGMMGMGIGRGLTERRLFAPLTQVLSPLVTRAQWVIVVRSALVGLVLACAVGGASIAIC